MGDTILRCAEYQLFTRKCNAFCSSKNPVMKCANPGLPWQAGFEGAGLWEFAVCRNAVFPRFFQRFWAAKIPVTKQCLTQCFSMLLGGVFRYWARISSINHRFYKVFCIRFRALIKLVFYQGKSRFWLLRKCHQECMIIPMLFNAFWVPFAGFAFKMIKKRQVLQCVFISF